MSRKSKTCGACSFSVPSEAIICGHCGAEFVIVEDKSFTGRIKSAFYMMLGLGFVGLIVGSFVSEDAGVTFAFLFGAVGMLIGFFSGSSKEKTYR